MDSKNVDTLRKEEKTQSGPFVEQYLRRVYQFYGLVQNKTFRCNTTTTDKDSPSNKDHSNTIVEFKVDDPAALMRMKIVRLSRLFSEILFHQCIVFCNDKIRCGSV